MCSLSPAMKNLNYKKYNKTLHVKLTTLCIIWLFGINAKKIPYEIL